MSTFAAKRASRAQDPRKPKSYLIYEKKSESDPQVGSSGPTSDFLANGSSTPDLYVGLPRTVEIRRDEKRGRGIWSINAIKRGHAILNQRPHVVVLGTQSLRSHCSFCISPSENGVTLKRCAKCRTVWYCSSACQNDDWRFHRRECSAIQMWISSAPDGSPPGEAVRSLGRILWGRKVEGYNSSWWREMEALQSHRTSIPASAVESHFQLSHALVRYMGATTPVELESHGIHSSGDLVDLISRFSTNTFTLTSPTLSPLGTCVSPIAALFNHSCLPNAVIVFPRNSKSTVNTAGSLKEPLLHVVAIKDISPGEEILTAYIDTSLPRFLRQQSLKETYNFECTCMLCTSVGCEKVDPREALWCPKSCGGMCPAPELEVESKTPAPRCTTCRTEFTLSALDDIKDKLRVGREALEKATSVQISDPVKSLKLTSHIISLLSSQVPPSAHPLLALLRLHLTLLTSSPSTPTDSGLLNDAIRSGARAVSGLTSVFVEGHPVRGICLAELGKLLAVDEPTPPEATTPNFVPALSNGFPPSGAARLALAVDTLKRALKELMIGFGETTGGGIVGKDIRETVIKLEDEMNVYSRGLRNVLEDMRRNGR